MDSLFQVKKRTILLGKDVILTNHENVVYHRSSVVSLDNLLQTIYCNNPGEKIDVQLQQQR